MALGSAYELQTQIFLSFDLELIKEEKMNKLISSLEEIQKMIYGLIKSIIKKKLKKIEDASLTSIV